MINTDQYSVGPLMRMNAHAFFNFMRDIHNSNPDCVYLELGIMSAKTLRGACQCLSETGKPWKAYGVDLNGGPWIKPEHRHEQIPRIRNNIGEWLTLINDGTLDTYKHIEKCGIYLTGTEEFLSKTGERFDFVFLDACHEGPCCTRDFLMVEPRIKTGGILAIHDTNPDIQGGDIQQHRNKPLEVRAMLECMGLLDGSRNGWKLILDMIHPINTDRGCVFLRRTT